MSSEQDELNRFIVSVFRDHPKGLATGELVKKCAERGRAVTWGQCVKALEAKPTEEVAAPKAGEQIGTAE